MQEAVQILVMGGSNCKYRSVTLTNGQNGMAQTTLVSKAVLASLLGDGKQEIELRPGSIPRNRICGVDTNKDDQHQGGSVLTVPVEVGRACKEGTKPLS